MWSLAVGPNQQVGIVPAQNATFETMRLDSRRLNDRRMGPPSRLAHDEALHAAPDFWSPGMPRNPSPIAEQDANAAGFPHAFVVATQCTYHQNAPVFKVTTSCRTPLPRQRRYHDGCVNHARMRSRTSPVFETQSVDPAEFSRIVGHQNDAQRCRVSPD